MERVVILDSDSDSETDSCEFSVCISTNRTGPTQSCPIMPDHFYDTDSLVGLYSRGYFYSTQLEGIMEAK